MCGVCGASVHAGGAVRDYAMYRCRSMAHVSRRASPINEYVEQIAVGVLRKPSSARLWLPGEDASKLMAEADVLRRRLADLAEDYDTMTREQFRTANEKVRSRLADVEGRIAATGSGSGPALRVAVAVDPVAEWAGLTVAQRRTIIDTLMTVTIYPVGRGVRVFREESVVVEPRRVLR